MKRRAAAPPIPAEIEALARECARDALADTPPGGAKLVCDVDEKYFDELARVLGRPYTAAEAYAFRCAFDLALPAAADEIQAKHELAAMLVELERQRDELELAEESADPRRCDRAALAVRGREVEIRLHCSRHELELPAEVST